MKNVLWLIQSNQVTATICSFLNLFKTRMAKAFNLSYIVPDTSQDVLKKIESLNPVVFKVNSRTATKSRQGYLAKRNILGNKTFTSGLTFTDALLLDDLGGGNVIQTTVNIEKSKDIACIVLQIPTPLGSSDNEERVFHATITWAHQNKIPVIGYELLPLDIRWTLATCLPDGIIVRYQESYDHLYPQLDHTNIWQLPLYEAGVFSAVANQFNIDGLKASYHYRATLKIPESRTVLYLPHNVAMIYEYQELIKILSKFGKHVHLMLSVGKDQVRGAHTHQEMIEIIYKNELEQFASHSFHNIDSPWEMLTADSIISCSACFQTMLAQEKNIPTIIFEPLLDNMSNGFKKRVNQPDKLEQLVAWTIEAKTKKRELGTVLLQLTRSMPSHD